MGLMVKRVKCVLVIILTGILTSFFINTINVYADSQSGFRVFDYVDLNNKESGWVIDSDSITYISEEKIVRQVADNEKEFKRDVVYYVLKDGYSGYDLEKAIRRSGQGNSYMEEWDTTYSAKIHATLYYSMLTSGQVNYYKVDRVEGGYTIADSNTTLVSQRVVVSCKDDDHLSQVSVYWPTVNNWTQYTSYFGYINSTHSSSVFGVVYRATLERPNGYQWEAVLRIKHLGGTLEEW